MASKVIHAIYTDDDLLLQAVKQVRDARYHITEIYSPFPVHGLDKAMGLEPTRLAIASFMYGVVGFAVAIIMMNFMMISDWPQDIGGKPSFSFLQNLPAFVKVHCCWRRQAWLMGSHVPRIGRHTMNSGDDTQKSN